MQPHKGAVGNDAEAGPVRVAGAGNKAFSLVAGGPFSRLLVRLGLTGPDQLPRPGAAIILALAAWCLPALAVTAQSLSVTGSMDWGYFQDVTVYTRYLVAVWMMIATESYADARLGLLVRQFDSAQILRGSARPRYQALLAWADRLSASALAEWVLLAISISLSVMVAIFTVRLAGAGWEGAVLGGEVSLSWAGYVTSFISNPFFLFLVFRWIWRFFVWTLLLYRISRLPLQLTPLHPDQSGGLGFLSIYPGVFSGFVFAIGCVVASSIIKDLGIEQHSMSTVWMALAVWMAFIMALFLGPLTVFSGPLYVTRERALLEYGRLASEHHLAFHQNWIDQNKSGAELLGSVEPSSVSDLNASVQAVREMRVFPMDFFAAAQLFLSGGVPLLAVIVHQIPMAKLVSWLVGVIL